MATVKDLTKQVQAMTVKFEELKESRDELKVNADALLAQLECPVCLDTCLPPIYMCRNGHNLCSNCRSKVNECPICREPGRPAIKNVFAEGVSRQFAVDCKYKEHGCPSLILKSKLEEHLLDCLYRFKCPECGGYLGDIPGLTQHLTAHHPTLYGEGEVYEGVFQVSSRCARYLYWDGGLFFCGIVPADNGLGLCTVFLGPRKNALDFHCWFEFTSEDGVFKVSYRVPCSPTDTNFKHLNGVFVKPDNLETIERSGDTVLCRIKIYRSNDFIRL